MTNCAEITTLQLCKSVCVNHAHVCRKMWHENVCSLAADIIPEGSLVRYTGGAEGDFGVLVTFPRDKYGCIRAGVFWARDGIVSLEPHDSKSRDLRRNSLMEVVP